MPLGLKQCLKLTAAFLDLHAVVVTAVAYRRHSCRRSQSSRLDRVVLEAFVDVGFGRRSLLGSIKRSPGRSRKFCSRAQPGQKLNFEVSSRAVFSRIEKRCRLHVKEFGPRLPVACSKNDHVCRDLLPSLLITTAALHEVLSLRTSRQVRNDGPNTFARIARDWAHPAEPLSLHCLTTSSTLLAKR